MPENFTQNFDYATQSKYFLDAKPFNHLIIDNFLLPHVVERVAEEFPVFSDPGWKIYDNAIEMKKLLNHYDRFGKITYQLFAFLNDRKFISQLEMLINEPLYPDIGLNGGGLHTHAKGGKLNVHLDYSIHPKLSLERRINLLIYLSKDWDPSWDGSLGFWNHDKATNGPGKLEKQIECFFNRAVIFDTTQNSWHGLPETILCPPDRTRNSLAIYYLCKPRPNASARGKALFSPYGDQSDNPEIMELIRKRSLVDSASTVYESNKKGKG